MTSPILVAGHKGLIGRSVDWWVVHHTRARPRHVSEGADLRDPHMAADAFRGNQTVFLCVGVGGGLSKNVAKPADLCRDTMLLLASSFEAARQVGARLVWFACACVYPGGLDRPAVATDLWGGPLEPTSRPFAAAQLAGIELTLADNRQRGTGHLALICPTVYGPHDDCSDDGHVLAIMLRRMHEAKATGVLEVEFWGDGSQRRQFAYADDVGRWAVEATLGDNPPAGVVNLVGEPALALRSVARAVQEAVGYQGAIRWSGGGPVGQAHKELGGPVRQPCRRLAEGLQRTVEWFHSQTVHNAVKSGG